jgi:general secretion pathway protein G
MSVQQTASTEVFTRFSDTRDWSCRNIQVGGVARLYLSSPDDSPRPGQCVKGNFTMSRTNCHSRAFTLVELLVVIGIIALLIGILIPTLSKAQQQAKITACMSNVRQLTQGWLMYTQDFKGNLPWAETNAERNLDGSINTANKARRDGWVVDVPGDPAYNTRASVEKGLLWKYCSAAETYRCPASIDTANLRSYSISNHMNGDPVFAGHLSFWESGLTPGQDPPHVVTKISKTKSDQLVMIEEFDERGANEGSFVQGRYWQYISSSGTHVWGDIPALFHKKGTVAGFVDGHSEYKRWDDPRTLVAKRNDRQNGNQDLLWLKKAIFIDPNFPKSSY